MSLKVLQNILLNVAIVLFSTSIIFLVSGSSVEYAIRKSPLGYVMSQPYSSEEEVLIAFNQWCQNGCTSLRSWRIDDLTEDDEILRGLMVMYHYDRDIRPIAQMVAGSKTRFMWGDLPEGVLGVFRTRSNTIVLSTRLRGESPSIVASILGHEVYHASQSSHATVFSELLQYVGSCYEEETEAFEWGAHVWEHSRLASEQSNLVPWLDALAQAWRNNELHSRVVEGYQSRCYS